MFKIYIGNISIALPVPSCTLFVCCVLVYFFLLLLFLCFVCLRVCRATTPEEPRFMTPEYLTQVRAAAVHQELER